MEISGKIIAVLQPKSGTSAKPGNQWVSQDFIVETPGQYPKKCVFTVFGAERLQQFGIRQGEELTVQVDIDAHEFNGRWYNEVRAYNVVRQQAQQPVQQGYQPQPQPYPQQTNYAPQQGGLPFPPAQ